MKSFVLLSLAALTAASHDLGISQSRRHHDLIARMPEADPNNNSTHLLEKRSFHGRASWFDDGMGACGQFSHPDDMIVALNTPQYGSGYPGPECFKKISITYNGITVGATIMDECPGCPYGGLDMSTGLFQRFTSLGTGIFYMEWSFDGESPPPPPPPPPKHTSTPKPSPSSTQHSTSTHHPSSSTSASESHTHHSSTTHDQSSTSTSASTSPTAAPTGPNNLIGLEQAIFDLAGILNAADPNTSQ